MMETTHMIKCDNCGTETHKAMGIDTWAVKEEKYFCMKCQEKLKIGWYEINENYLWKLY